MVLNDFLYLNLKKLIKLYITLGTRIKSLNTTNRTTRNCKSDVNCFKHHNQYDKEPLEKFIAGVAQRQCTHENGIFQNNISPNVIFQMQIL